MSRVCTDGHWLGRSRISPAYRHPTRPDHPELVLDTANTLLDECVDEIVNNLLEEGVIPYGNNYLSVDWSKLPPDGWRRVI
jgi:hypothetical protein